MPNFGGGGGGGLQGPPWPQAGYGPAERYVIFGKLHELFTQRKNIIC